MPATFHIPQHLILPLVMCIAGLILMLLAFRMMRGRYRRQFASQARGLERIRLEEFATVRVADLKPQLELYNVPVRLALVVIAPAGRNSRVPPHELWPEMLDQAIPQIRNALAGHGTEFRTWPAQLSADGFRETFFHQIGLPDRGKGNAWSAAAGSIATMGQRFLVGILVRADEPNNLGQFPIDREPQWLDMLRVINS